MTKRKNKGGKAVVYVLIALVFAGAVFISINFTKYYNRYKKNIKESSVLYLRTGSDYQTLLDSLAPKLKNMASFVKVANKEGLPGHVRPGRYVLKTTTTNIQLVRAIKHGYQDALTVTIAGTIRSKEKLAAVLGRKMEDDSLAFITEFNDSTVLASLGLNKDNFLTLFIPDSYEMYWTVTPAEFIAKMKAEYDKFWDASRVAKAQAMGLTKPEVSTLASIVCDESNYVPEYPNIASVYLNRYHKGDRLCADPTVKFALHDQTIKRILFRHLQVDSPYNTYKHTGLPPGPILIPSKAGIDGVLNAAKTNYMYFCANPKLNGTHLFAVTDVEHAANARKYQHVLDSLERAKRAAAAGAAGVAN